MLLNLISIRSLGWANRPFCRSFCFFSISLLLLCLCFSKGLAQIQTADSLLPVVEIQGIPYQEYTAGIHLQKIDSFSLHSQASQSLSQLLLQRSPLYFKEYGAGQLATVSFRGTGANHTAVLWNGLPVNSPTLGQADFSLLPLFAMSEVQVQYGSSSALYGSGALGGSVQLQSGSQQHRQSYARARLEAGSFGRLFTGIAAGFTKGQWQAGTKLYRNIAENDFTYINTLLPGRPREQNHNSAFAQQGVVQDVRGLIGQNGELQLNLWWQHTDRQIQQRIGVRFSQDQQQDEQIRLNLEYKQHGDKLSWQAQGGWVQDELTYNGSPFWSRQLIGQLQAEYAFNQKTSLQAGSRINQLLSRNNEYEGGSAEELRNDLFAMFRWNFAPAWSMSANARQLLVRGYQAPLAPSLGLEGTVWQRGIHLLKLRSSAGRSYRVPTFNDRFWPIAGNPALRPERAWSAEAGFDYSLRTASRQEIKLHQTFYSIWSDDWIQWRPAENGLWRPRNLLQVHSRGIEAQLELLQPLSQGLLSVGGQMAYTRSTNEKPSQPYDWTVGKQLAFTPLWRGNSWARLQLQQWAGAINWSYTGRRYTDGTEDSSRSLPSFALLDISLGRDFHYKQHRWHTSLQLQNLFNKQYQNYERRAMPGRSILLVFDYQFKL